jgi:hypothetical protein
MAVTSPRNGRTIALHRTRYAVQNAFAESCILRLRDELLNAVPLTAMSRLKEKAKPPSD